MGEIGEFSERIRKCLFQHEKEKAERLLRVDSQMKQLLEKRESFNTVARRILSSVVHPRMQELSRNFENSTLKEPGKVEGFRSVCLFSPTERFPASVSLDFTFSSSGFYERLDVHYNLEIVPALLEYVRYDKYSLNLESASLEEEMEQWVEAKILDFLETYLKLESHPDYQKENYVVDPVCQMRIPMTQAVARIERGDRTIYFCSETCRDAFMKEST